MASKGPCRWKVGLDPWGSDHFPIMLSLNKKFEPQSRGNTNKRRYTRKTDWENFASLMMKQLINLETLIKDNHVDTQVKYTTLVSTIEDAIQSSTLKTKNNDPRRKECNLKLPSPAPWWTQECDKMLRLRFAAFKKLNDF